MDSSLVLETATAALATFFATIAPLDAAAVFAALTGGESSKYRRRMAIRGSIIASCILISFAVIGDTMLSMLGISIPALRTAGGILLLLIGIEMVFARSSGSTSTTEEEQQEAIGKRDISVFPIATPLIAGPGAMGAAILLMVNAEGELILQAVVLSSLILVLLLTFVMLRLASNIQRLLGVTGMQVVERIFGVLLSALAVQFIFDGISQSGILIRSL
jgi:multiple antibiotic resistance protein